MNSNTIFRLISALLIATYIRAASPTTRPCTPADLDGVYQMAQFRETPAANLTLQVQSAPYHILAFYPSAKWAAQAFNVTPTSPDAVDKYLQPQMRKGQTYSLEPDGRLTLTRGKTIQFAGTCLAALETVGGFQKTDLILNGNQTGVRSELHQLFRHWTAGPASAVASDFDPVPSATERLPSPATTLEDVRPTLPDEPAPLRAQVGTGPGRKGAEGVGVAVTNQGNMPLSAFMLVYRDAQTGGKWMDVFVDACLDHHSAWQPRQQWKHEFGLLIETHKLEAHVGAAIFSDGNTWGDPHLLAKLKQHHGSCQWPGS